MYPRIGDVVTCYYPTKFGVKQSDKWGILHSFFVENDIAMARIYCLKEKIYYKVRYSTVFVYNNNMIPRN